MSNLVDLTISESLTKLKNKEIIIINEHTTKE